MAARKKILLVDDSSTVRLLERLVLDRQPYELIEASDGLEAVERAVAERPDLILMDVLMPRLNGLEACQRLREVAETRAIPVIMVTTRGELDALESGYAAGCSDYVTKPISGLELLTKIRSCLGE
jgi:CheY-like chemotaxis protein